MSRCRNSYVEQALLPRRLEDLAGEEAGPGGYRAHLQDSLDALLKEAKDKFRGYDSCSTPEHAELACRKVRNGPLSPLRPQPFAPSEPPRLPVLPSPFPSRASEYLVENSSEGFLCRNTSV